MNNALLIILFCAITLDLMKVNSPIFKEGISGYRIDSLVVTKNPFRQLYMSAKENYRYGGATSMYPVLLKNQGIVNGYEAINVLRAAIPFGVKGYRGEYFLLRNEGKLTQTYWSPNKMTFYYEITRPNILVINQNYDKNWKTTTANPVEPLKDLISVRLDPRENEITVYYFPMSFVYGIIILCVGLLLVVLRKVYNLEWINR